MYKFFVPNDPGIHSLGVTLDLAGNSSKVRMFVSVAKDENVQPSSTNSIQTLPSWFGLTARVYEDNPYLFCRNCTYKVLITSNEDVMYMLNFQTSKSVTKIKGSQYQSYEMVHSGERNCYEFPIKDSDDVLEVYLNTFSGDPDIYVNPLTLPQTTAGFAFSSRGSLDEILTITPEQRRLSGALVGTYFICIYGTRPSSYSVLISAGKEGTETKIPIYSGLTRTAIVKEDQLKVFEYINLVQEKTNVTFTLTSHTGNADLYIKYCVEDLNDFGAAITPCELTSGGLKDPNLYKSEQASTSDILTIQYDPKECKIGAGKKRCSYLVGVLGKADSRFSLSVLGNSQDETPLVEGQAFFGYVGLKQENRYSFVVTDPETTLIKIQLTSLSGDADLYISRRAQGAKEGAERYSNQASFLPDAVYFNKTRDGPLNTSYHLTVVGHTSATFTIMYTTTSPGGKERSILLADGLPQAGVINGTTPETSSMRYYFMTSYFESDKQDISIHLIALSGSYQVFVGADYMPTTKNYTWSMSELDSNVHILASDPNYRPKGKYHILVAKSRTDDPYPHIFSIKYMSGQFATNIAEGQPEMGNLTRGEMLYYKYNVISLEGSITVTVTPFSGDPDLYISINSSNDKPEPINNDYMSAAIGPDSIRIPTSEILKKTPSCSFSAYLSTTCAVFVGVKCASEICTYSLQVGRSSQLVLQLLDGVPQFGTVAGGDPQYYLFTPTSATEGGVISVFSKKGKVKAFMKMASWEVTDPSRPAPDSYDLSSNTRANTEVLEITGSRARSCGFLCRYYIGIFADASQAMPGQATEAEFTIVATSGVKHLIDGQTVVDNVGEKVYKYYQFTVPCRDCVLSISVTPLSAGDPDIFVNRGKLRLPNSQNAEFKSISYRGDFLQIKPTDPLIQESRRLMRGTYLIGVYGSQNCTYSITATTSASVVQDINQGIPIRQEQQQGKISYFMFYSWKKASILISLAMHSGRATIRATVVTSVREASVLDQLPVSEVKSKWSSLKSNTINRLIIDQSDPAFQEFGIYFIAVEAEETSNYDISVEYVSAQDYALLKIADAARVHLGDSEVKKYTFEITTQQPINIQLSLFYGSVEGSISTSPTGDALWKLPVNSGLIIKNTDPNFRLGTYYLTLRASQESDMSIMIEQNAQVIWLSEGLPQKAEIETGAYAYFYYMVPRQQTAQQLRLNIYATVKSGNIENPVMYIRHITRADSNRPDRHNADYMALWDPDLKQLGVTIDLQPDKSRTLAIAVGGNVQDTQRQKGEFSIVAWTTGFAILVPDNLYTNKFDSLNDMHVYELPLKKVSRAYLEVIPCVGEVEFFVTKNLASISDRKYDLKKTELSKGKLFGALQDPQGIYYVSVRAIGYGTSEGAASKSIQYSIKAIISNETSAADLEDFALENYGTIDSYLDGDELTLTWGAPYLRGNTDKRLMSVKYAVYMAEDTGANMNTICGIKYGKAQLVAGDISARTFTYNIKEKRPTAKKLTFNVLATVEDYKYTVAYNPLPFQVPRPPRVSRLYIAVMIVLVLVLGGAAIYFWKKYRSAMKQLEYEMNDVRNLGNISTVREVPAGKAETYLHLRTGTEEAQ